MSSNGSTDDPSQCAFTYSDGRHCRMSRSRKSRFCLPHERKLRHICEADYTAAEICEPLSKPFVPATALTRALTRTFQAVAEGRIDPKAATALARLASTLLKSLPQSIAEFREYYKDEYWGQLIDANYAGLPPFIDDQEEDNEEDKDNGENDDGEEESEAPEDSDISDESSEEDDSNEEQDDSKSPSVR